MLKERHEIESNYNHLHKKLSHLQAEENERKEKVSNFCENFPNVCKSFR
jgi:seryl-tRNA synthetase